MCLLPNKGRWGLNLDLESTSGQLPRSLVWLANAPIDNDGIGIEFQARLGTESCKSLWDIYFVSMTASWNAISAFTMEDRRTTFLSALCYRGRSYVGLAMSQISLIRHNQHSSTRSSLRQNETRKVKHGQSIKPELSQDYQLGYRIAWRQRARITRNGRTMRFCSSHMASRTFILTLLTHVFLRIATENSAENSILIQEGVFLINVILPYRLADGSQMAMQRKGVLRIVAQALW